MDPSLLFLLLILVVLSGFLNTPPNGVGSQEVIVVPDDYPSLYDAIRNAEAGSVVFVKSGYYRLYRTIVIDKPLVIVGEDKYSTIIHVVGDIDAFIIENTSSVLITGFTIEYGSRQIVVYGSDNVFIGGNVFREWLNNSIYIIGYSGHIPYNTSIIDNLFIGNSTEPAIALIESMYTRITSNTFNIDTIGILINNSRYNIISGNIFIGSGIVFTIDSISIGNTIVDNIVNGKPLVYLEDETGATISGAIGQVILVRCGDIVVRNAIVYGTVNAIQVLVSNNVSIVNSTVYGSSIGVSISRSSGVRVVDSLFRDNDVGVYIVLSRNVSIEGNSFYINSYGVYITDTLYSMVEITDNVFIGDKVAGVYTSETVSHVGIISNRFYRDGVIIYSRENNVYGNLVNDKPLVYMEDVYGGIVSGSIGQLVLIECSETTITDTVIENTSVGVLIAYSNHVSIENISALYNGYGVILYSTTWSIIYSSTIASTNTGLYIKDSFYNLVVYNNIEYNREGIRIQGSRNNRIYLNNFINNTIQAVTVNSKNTWDNGTHGNYWSDYRGVDRDSDMVGDEPYIIDKENIDNHPLLYTIAKPIHTLIGLDNTGQHHSFNETTQEYYTKTPVPMPEPYYTPLVLATCIIISILVRRKKEP